MKNTKNLLVKNSYLLPLWILQLCIWSIDNWEKKKVVPIQLPAGKAPAGDTRVQFHADQVRLLVAHETQLAIYDTSKMDRIRQVWFGRLLTSSFVRDKPLVALLFYLFIYFIYFFLQWVPQDALTALISYAAYSCNSQLVYASFCDGNVGVFDADTLRLRCRVAPSAYLSQAVLNG